MRWSRYFLQTVREVPGDADAVSHVLLSRAGMIRRVAAGIYSLTPLGLRSHRKAEQIVREEIDRAGGLEVELPILQPRELWDESGRWTRYEQEQILFHLKDRKANNGPALVPKIKRPSGSRREPPIMLPIPELRQSNVPSGRSAKIDPAEVPKKITPSAATVAALAMTPSAENCHRFEPSGRMA